MSKIISDIDKSYLAGFYDGEGSINIRKQIKKKYSNTYIPTVSVSNTHKPNILFIKKLYGGIIELQSASANKKMKKKLWRLRFNQYEIEIFLKDITLFLKIKKVQAKLLLKLINILKNKVKRNKYGQIRKLTKNKIKIREKIFQNYLKAQKTGKSLYKNRKVTKW